PATTVATTAPAPVAPAPAPPRVVRPRTLPPAAPSRRVEVDAADEADAAACDFSLYFFGDYPDHEADDKYGLIMEAAEFADRNGFHSLWFPERHFNSFGALFPNPSVLAAALAARTSRIMLQAGSVVLPLHHPVRVAEEWSVVDNLSGGRAGLCVASGWHATDFSLAPENYGRNREVMYENLAAVEKLWSGAPLAATAGDGSSVELRLHPRPVQKRLPLYVAVVGNPDSYRRAAAEDLGVVTNLMTQTVDQLAENIALYRRTRAEHGLDPDAGRVVVLVHTYLEEDAESARATAYRPFVSYLKSSLALFGQVTNSLGFEIDLDNAPEADVEFLLERAYERYCESRALIGDERSVAGTVRRLAGAGADEIACFVDFGVAKDEVLASLPALDRLRRGVRGVRGAGGAPGEEPAATAPRRAPLSPAQRRIWFLEQAHPGTSMYHEPKAIRLDGPLDVPTLRGALRQVAGRHESLRTVFREHDGDPYRLVLDRVDLDCPVEDRDGETFEDALRAVLETEGRRVFDLGSGPLLSARLIRLSDECHLLFLLAHHLVFDSSSTTVLARDLAACYQAGPDGEPALPALPATPEPAPADPARVAASREYWRRTLEDAPELTLPTDRPRPAVRTGAGAGLTHELDGALVDRLKKFTARHRTTLFMALTGAVAAVVGRFSGQDDVVLGTVVAARPAGAEDRIGLYLDTVPVRLDLGGDPTFRELLHRVRESSMSAYEHRDLPFEELVAALNPRRDPGRNPYFQVMVEYENEGHVDFDPPRLTATLHDVPSERAPFDLSVYLTHHGEGVRFMVEYDTALFDASTVRRLVEYVEEVLRRALDAPEAPLSAATVVTDTDRALLTRLGGPGEERPLSGDTLHGLFRRQAALTPDAVALVGDDLRVTYRELESRALALAGRLRAGGARVGTRVAVLAPRGPELVTALLGVLVSGAAYVPLDPSLPGPRLAALLADSDPALLLAHSGALAPHPELASGMPVELIDAAGSGPRTVPAEAPDGGAGPEDPAYCLYTSGSTGSPKGVLVPHRGPVNLVRGHLGRHAALRTLQWTSPAFDVSVQEIFTTLASGAALVLIDDAVRHDPSALAAAVREHGVERMFMPCTPLTHLMETAPEMPSLRELFSAGEALLLTGAFRRFLDAHPDCVLHNQYGPTETSVIVTSHRVDPGAGDSPPIGTPVPGTRVRLLDPAGREVPVGAAGEICVSGVPVALGYHGRPRETAAAFVDDGAGSRLYRTGDLGRWGRDGALAYLGRIDDQVKIRGHRVEPGEVRGALLALAAVRDAAVVSCRDAHGDTELVAYVVPEASAPELTELWAGLRAELAAAVPDHLVPRRWVRLERLPVNTSGKLDRDRLPAPGREETRPEGGDPVTPLEKTLHDLWCDELGLDRVPVTGSFFELGGHSLSAIRLLNRMGAELGSAVSMAGLFRAPTIRGVAALLQQEDAEPADPAEAAPPAPTGGEAETVVPMTSALRRLWRRHHERPDPGVYNVAHRIDLHMPVVPDDLRRALADLVARHDALRSRAVRRDGEYLVEVLADLPVDLPVTDLSGHPQDGESVRDWCREHAARPFAMDRAPLFRFRLARLGADRWTLVVVMHHAICDGWSMGVLWRELGELYDARRAGDTVPLPPPAAQFTSYARAEHELGGRRRTELEEFWRAELEEVPLTLDLPVDRARPAALSGRGALHSRALDGAAARRIADAAQRLGTSSYTVLLAGFAAWAARCRGRSADVVVAASSANRLGADRAELVGQLGEAVLLRARIGEAVTFADLVRQLTGTLFDALDHQALPLAEVAELVAPGTSGGLFPDVLFTVVTTTPPVLRLGGEEAEVRGLPTEGVARTELYVVLVPGEDGMTLTFEYSTDLFDDGTVQRWAGELADVLDQAVRDPEGPLARLTGC
ncbi:non-ribosomal peptide synthetase, partial [Streptomyces sp. SM12]|uniref:non-ribosomal peptide synthetase n=1 Tax=Streptomyces sp. SM12 TaxID=1071602 RepID=UPI0011B048C8